MKLDCLKQQHIERILEWVTGGSYAVAVEVDATIYPDRPAEPYLTPETVRYLERLRQLAEAGDVEALKQVGTVYVRLGEPASLATAGMIDGKQRQ